MGGSLDGDDVDEVVVVDEDDYVSFLARSSTDSDHESSDVSGTSWRSSTGPTSRSRSNSIASRSRRSGSLSSRSRWPRRLPQPPVHTPFDTTALSLGADRSYIAGPSLALLNAPEMHLQVPVHDARSSLAMPPPPPPKSIPLRRPTMESIQPDSTKITAMAAALPPPIPPITPRTRRRGASFRAPLSRLSRVATKVDMSTTEDDVSVTDLIRFLDFSAETEEGPGGKRPLPNMSRALSTRSFSRPGSLHSSVSAIGSRARGKSIGSVRSSRPTRRPSLSNDYKSRSTVDCLSAEQILALWMREDANAQPDFAPSVADLASPLNINADIYDIAQLHYPGHGARVPTSPATPLQGRQGSSLSPQLPALLLTRSFQTDHTTSIKRNPHSINADEEPSEVKSEPFPFHNSVTSSNLSKFDRPSILGCVSFFSTLFSCITQRSSGDHDTQFQPEDNFLPMPYPYLPMKWNPPKDAIYVGGRLWSGRVLSPEERCPKPLPPPRYPLEDALQNKSVPLSTAPEDTSTPQLTLRLTITPRMIRAVPGPSRAVLEVFNTVRSGQDSRPSSTMLSATPLCSNLFQTAVPERSASLPLVTPPRDTHSSRDAGKHPIRNSLRHAAAAAAADAAAAAATAAATVDFVCSNGVGLTHRRSTQSSRTARSRSRDREGAASSSLAGCRRSTSSSRHRRRSWSTYGGAGSRDTFVGLEEWAEEDGYSLLGDDDRKALSLDLMPEEADLAMAAPSELRMSTMFGPKGDQPKKFPGKVARPEVAKASANAGSVGVLVMGSFGNRFTAASSA